MAKNTYKATCESTNANKQTSQARFTIDEKAAPAAPGQPITRTARTVIAFAFTDPKEASKFEPGKSYTITVE